MPNSPKSQELTCFIELSLRLMSGNYLKKTKKTVKIIALSRLLLLSKTYSRTITGCPRLWIMAPQYPSKEKPRDPEKIPQ
jgi:hypothetical protein